MRAGQVIALVVGGVLVAGLANDLSNRVTRGDDDTRATVAGAANEARAARPGTASLVKADDGQFYAEALVGATRGDRTRVRFLVDTGASTVALTPADARRVGVELDELVYDTPVRTANGETRAAYVRLARVSVSGIELRDVDALVMRDELAQSLLGMSYLGRLSRMETAGDALILRR